MTDISTNKRNVGKYARTVLFNSYALLLFATLFYIAMQVGFIYIGNCFGSLLYGISSDDTAALVSITFMIIAIIVTVPLNYGYVSVIIKVCAGDEVSVSELFAFYSDRASVLSAYASFLRLIPGILAFGIAPAILLPSGFILIDKFMDYAYPLYGGFLIEAATKLSHTVLTALVLLLCFYFSGKVLASFLVDCIPDSNLRVIRIDKWGFMKLRLTMLPLIALSVLSFGILFIVYTIPFILICYVLFLDVDALYEKSVYDGKNEESEASNETEAAIGDSDTPNTDTIIFNTPKNGDDTGLI